MCVCVCVSTVERWSGEEAAEELRGGEHPDRSGGVPERAGDGAVSPADGRHDERPHRGRDPDPRRLPAACARRQLRREGDLARLGDGALARSSSLRQGQSGRSLTRVTCPQNMTLKARHKVKEIWHTSEMARSLGVLLSDKDSVADR